MATPPPTKAKGKGIMKAKVGPVPVPLLIAAVVIVGVYIYMRRSAGNKSTSAGTNASPETSPTYPGGDSTGGGTGGMDLSALFDTLAAQAQALSNQGTPLYAVAPTPDLVAASPTAGPDLVTATGDGNTSPPIQSSSSQPATSYRTSASDPHFAQTATSKTAAAKAAGVAAPFGGVVSTKTLKNGSTLTTYKSGRQVQQAPGKTAYVVRK